MRVARIAALSVVAMLGSMARLGAQQDSARSVRPAHRIILVTNIGPALGLDAPGSGVWGLVADWGLMVNTTPRYALGASYSASLGRGKFEAGPALRYRRWLRARRALDVAVGWGGEPRTDKLTKGYALFGRVELSVGPSLGLALEGSRRGALLGVQLSSGPGLIASAIGAVVASLGAIRPGL